MKVPFTGGCACGAVRYDCTAEPIMMLKCHCRDCQHITAGGFAAAVLLPAEAFRLTKGELTYHFTPSLSVGNTNAVFVRIVARALQVPKNTMSLRASSASLRGAWMIRAGFVRRWISSHQKRSRGIKWILRFQNTKSTRRWRKTAD
jgi:hypothetical protein